MNPYFVTDTQDVQTGTYAEDLKKVQRKQQETIKKETDAIAAKELQNQKDVAAAAQKDADSQWHAQKKKDEHEKQHKEAEAKNAEKKKHADETAKEHEKTQEAHRVEAERQRVEHAKKMEEKRVKEQAEKQKSDQDHRDKVDRANVAHANKTAETHRQKAVKEAIHNKNVLEGEKAKHKDKIRRQVITELETIVKLQDELSGLTKTYMDGIEQDKLQYSARWTKIVALYHALKKMNAQEGFAEYVDKYLKQHGGKQNATGVKHRKSLLQFLQDVKDGKTTPTIMLCDEKVAAKAAKPAEPDPGMAAAIKKVDDEVKDEVPAGPAEGQLHDANPGPHPELSKKGNALPAPAGFESVDEHNCVFRFHVLDCEVGHVAEHLAFGALLWEAHGDHSFGLGSYSEAEIAAAAEVPTVNPYTVSSRVASTGYSRVASMV